MPYLKTYPVEICHVKESNPYNFSIYNTHIETSVIENVPELLKLNKKIILNVYDYNDIRDNSTSNKIIEKLQSYGILREKIEIVLGFGADFIHYEVIIDK